MKRVVELAGGHGLLIASLGVGGMVLAGGCSLRPTAKVESGGKETPGAGRVTADSAHRSVRAADDRPETGVVGATGDAPEMPRFQPGMFNALGEARRATAPASIVGMEIILEGLEGLQQVSFSSDGSDFDPAVTPDGKSIVFASTQHRATADLYIKSVGGRTVTQLTADPADDIMPTISPDGRRVAFASNRASSWDLYVMSIGGGQAAQVTSGASHDLHPSWSPDGSRLVFCRLGESSGRWEMWVLPVEQPAAAEFVGYGVFPEWCPVAGTGAGGRDRIVFQRGRERGDRAFGVWTIDYKPGDAGNLTEIASFPGRAGINPSWSPDGRHVVFATVPLSEPDGMKPGGARRESDVWICALDGSGLVNLTGGRAVNSLPKWGLDGRIYFVSDRSGSDNIWSVGTGKALLASRGVPVNESASGEPGAKSAVAGVAEGGQ